MFDEEPYYVEETQNNFIMMSKSILDVNKVLHIIINQIDDPDCLSGSSFVGSIMFFFIRSVYW